MAFSLRLAGVTKAQRYERAREVARILQLEPLLNRKPKKLSGGQRQRVAIGRALVRKPKVFLFDEPLPNLDAALRVQMRIELASLHDSLQTAMIYVTLIVQTDGDNSSRLRDLVLIQINGELCHLFNQQGEAIFKARRHHLTIDQSHEQQYQHRIGN